MDFLPDDILERIFRNLWVGDRIRHRLVCKSWNRILMQNHYPAALEAPWEILSADTYNQPETCLPQICFKSLSEERIYRFNLPTFDGHDDIKGGRLCGCSRGWLAMAVGPDLNPDIFLWNPVTGAIRKLPSLYTLSFYGDCVADQVGGIKIPCFSSVIMRVEVFSLGYVECVVAMLFLTCTGSRIALCTPQEAGWTTFNAEVAENVITYADVMFHATSSTGGKLKILCEETFESETQRETFLSKKIEITLTDCRVEVNPVLVPNKDINILEIQLQAGSLIPQRTTTRCRLVESSITRQVLVVVVDLHILIIFGTGLTQNSICEQTIHMSVHPHDMVSMAKEAIFLATTGCLSVPTVQGIVPDCIYFVTDNANGRYYDNNNSEYRFLFREHGQFFINENKLSRKYSTTIKYWPESKVGWFMPQL